MKKMVSLVVALAMLLLLLCACGQTEEPQNSPEVQNTGEPVADESEGFTIGFANVFVGNTWRAQYVADAEAMAEQLKAEGTTMLGIFHDLEFMEGLCDHEFNMQEGMMA